jgi:glycosyltransferase involved in cell wall biosynthesis
MLKVILKGPILTQTGYGHHARTVLRALRSRTDLFDIYIQPIIWGHTSWLWDNNEERRWIDNTLTKTIAHTQSGGKFDISLQVTIPNEWEKIAPINIGVTAGIETTKVAPVWVEKSFLMDKIITISNHSKQTYENTACNFKNEQTGEEGTIKPQTSIDFVSYPVRKYDPVKLDLDLKTDFNFLSVAQLSPRKNTDQTIRCFIENFKDNENVGLIIKANIAKNSLIDKNSTLSGLRKILSNYPDRKCKIYLLHGYLTDQEMAALYTNSKIKAIVSTTHGEGFGLPLFEAAYYGLPIIATDWSGHLDFLYKPVKQKNGTIKNKHMFSRVSYTLQPVQKEAVWDGVIQKDSMWAYPEEGSVKMAMDELYKDHGRFKKRSKELQKWVCKEFTEEKKYDEFIKILEPYNVDLDEEVDDLFTQLATNQ